MAAVPIVQASFTGGELSPEVYARTDIAKYSVGARLLRNFFVKATGGASNRSGLQFTVHCKSDAEICRLIPFQFNAFQTYTLAFQNQSMRVIRDGAIVLEPSFDITGATSTDPVVITAVGSSYSDGDEVFISGVGGMVEINERFFIVNHVLFAADTIIDATKTDPVVVQTSAAHGLSNGARVFIEAVGGMVEINDREFTVENVTVDTFDLVGEDGTGHTLYTSGGTSKEIDDDLVILQGEDGSGHTTYTSGGTIGRVFTLITPYLEADLFDIKFTQSGDIMTLCHPEYDERDLSRTDHHVWNLDVIIIGPILSVPQTVGGTYTGTGTGIDYSWVVAAFDEDTGEESIASAAQSEANKDLSNAGDSMEITWTAPATGNATHYNIYKDEDGSGFYGFIGSSNNLTFTDRNVSPEFGDSPALTTRDPFPGVDDRPSVVAYHQGRRWFGNTNNNPQTMFGSVSANFKNFNTSKAVRDDDAVTATMAGLKIDAIRHLVALGPLLIFTAGSEWIMASSSASKPITPTTVSFSLQTSYGSSQVPPIVIGNTALFVTQRDTKIRDVTYNLETDGYTGNDLSILADHLFDDFAVVDWAYAMAPHSLVWLVRDDGQALSLAYLRTEQIWAWSRHDTEGFFESVSSVTEGQEDAVYFVVRRVINGVTKRFIERLHSRKFKDVRDAFFVDSGLSLDLPVAISGATQTDPVVVSSTAHGFSNGDEIEIVGVVGMTDLNELRFTVASVTANTYELQNTDGPPVDIDGTAFAAYISGGVARELETVISGFRHLAGEDVHILADGNVIDPLTVSATGTITLPASAARVHAGLQFVADLETLDPHFEFRNGGTQGQKRETREVTFKFTDSRGGWAGSNVNNLMELKQRTDEPLGAPTRLQCGEQKVNIGSRQEDRGRVFYRQLDPLPVTILGLVPEVRIGG